MSLAPRRILFWLSAVVGVVFCQIGSAADQPTGVAPPSAPSTTTADYRRPELVAITWSTAYLAPMIDDRQPFWRPDGSLLDADEIAWIRKDLGEFQRVEWQKAIEHRALILIFRVDEKSKGHGVSPYLRIGERTIAPCLVNSSSKNFLTANAIAPKKTDFAEWPAEIDLDVQWPTGPAERFKQVDGVPKEPVAIAQGVWWYFDSTAGRSRSGQAGYPACVLELTKDAVEPLRKYQFVVNLEGGKQESMTSSHDQPDRILMATAPIDEKFKIKSTDFYLTRYRRERIDKIPTFPERLVK